MHYATILPLSLTLVALVLPAAAVEPMLGGIHVTYTPIIDGEIKADGRTTEHKEGARYGVHFRDYYFEQDSHHPFAEIGILYESYKTNTTNFELDTESIGVNLTIGSAIPLSWMADQSFVMGVSPEIGLNLGSFEADINSSDGVTNQHSSDSSFRYGLIAGIGGWMVFNRSFTLGAGLYGSYWRATGITVVVPTGTGTEQRTTNPSGWDVGVRMGFGFLF